MIVHDSDPRTNEMLLCGLHDVSSSNILQIMEYLATDNPAVLVTLAKVSKRFKEIVFSPMARQLWDAAQFSLCRPRNSVGFDNRHIYATASFLEHILVTCKIIHVVVYCCLRDLDKIMSIIMEGSLVLEELSIDVMDFEPSEVVYFLSSNSPQPLFPNLKSFCLSCRSLVKVRSGDINVFASRMNKFQRILLQLMGNNLQQLSLSPCFPDIFADADAFLRMCPKLLHLNIDCYNSPMDYHLQYITSHHSSLKSVKVCKIEFDTCHIDVSKVLAETLNSAELLYSNVQLSPILLFERTNPLESFFLEDCWLEDGACSLAIDSLPVNVLSVCILANISHYTSVCLFSLYCKFALPASAANGAGILSELILHDKSCTLCQSLGESEASVDVDADFMQLPNVDVILLLFFHCPKLTRIVLPCSILSSSCIALLNHSNIFAESVNHNTEVALTRSIVVVN